MHNIQEAVRSYLERESGIAAVCAPDRCAGRYPVLAVGIFQEDTVLLSGGQQARCRFALSVTAAAGRERQGEAALLSGLVPILLRGIPVKLPVSGGQAVRRHLSPLHLRTEGDTLRFSLQLCLPVPPGNEAAAGTPEPMAQLYLSSPGGSNQTD